MQPDRRQTQPLLSTIEDALMPTTIEHMVGETVRLPNTQRLPVETDPLPWVAQTADDSLTTMTLSSLLYKTRPLTLQRPFHPLDRLRWWLLHPGIIERICYVVGLFLLTTITSVFLFIIALTFGWLALGPAIQPDTTIHLPALVTTPGLKLTRVDQGPLSPGQPMGVHGEGFGSDSSVIFILDKKIPLLGQDGKLRALQTDNHGTFTTKLPLSYGFPLTPGQHTITVYEYASTHSTTLTFDVEN